MEFRIFFFLEISVNSSTTVQVKIQIEVHIIFKVQRALNLKIIVRDNAPIISFCNN